MATGAEERPWPAFHFGLAWRVAATLVVILAALAGVMHWSVVPATEAAFAKHGEGLLREGSTVMQDLAAQQTADTSTVLVDLIRHTTTARQRALQDLPLALYADDLDAMRRAIEAEDASRSARQQANVETLAGEIERRANAEIAARLDALAVRQRDQTAAFASALRRDHLLLVATTLAVLVLVFGFGIHALVVRPTLRLRAATRRLVHGDLDVQLPARSRDELGDLTRDFADLVRQLRESRARVERLTAGLEHEVRNKTQHLEKALADLSTSHQQLAQAERLASLGTLAGGIAHEFHNLIGGIRGCVVELAADETSPERRETLAVITRAADRATGIVQQLLRFARRSVERTSDIDVATIVEDALRLCEPAARRADVRVERELAPGLVVRGDSDGLHQVLVNLLTNALQAMPRGGTLRAGAKRTDANEVELTVSDTGPGIAEKDLPHVFEPFFTTKGDAADPAHRGSGLGLSVSWGIVQAHGGRITASSSPGAGATFTVTLPQTRTSGS